MRIVFISDTHGRHRELSLPEGDVLIHAGDLSRRGRSVEIADFMNWFGHLPHPHKVVVAGNHDFLAEDAPDQFLALVPDAVTYLNDSGAKIEGISIWGSPITPWFYDWAFNRDRGPKIKVHWDLIPPETDILITHGPPQGILDLTASGDRAGCADLLATVKQIQPRIHVFGHIHEAYGQQMIERTRFINASTLNLQYQIAHSPVVVDWE